MKPRLIVALIYLFAGLFISFILFLGLSFFLFISTLSAGEFLMPQSNASPIMYYFLIFTSLFVGIIPISIYLSRFYSKPKVFIIGIAIALVLTGIVIGIYNVSSNSNEVIETSSSPISKPASPIDFPTSPTGTFILITEKDTGKSYPIKLATRAYLRLSTSNIWTQPKVSGNAIELVPVNYKKYVRDPGFSEWEIKPIRPGNATIVSTGTVNCVTGSNCPTYVLAFRVDITVSQ